MGSAREFLQGSFAGVLVGEHLQIHWLLARWGLVGFIALCSFGLLEFTVLCSWPLGIHCYMLLGPSGIYCPVLLGHSGIYCSVLSAPSGLDCSSALNAYLELALFPVGEHSQIH